MKLNIPDLKNIEQEKLSRAEVRQLYYNLQSDKLNVIKNHSLMYAIGRTVDKLKPIIKKIEPDYVIPNYDQYKEDLQKLHEKLSGGKTVETRSGEKIYDINYNGIEYTSKLEEIKEEYGINEYEDWMNQPFDEEVPIHYVNNKEVTVEKDVPDYGIYKLIKILFKEE